MMNELDVKEPVLDLDPQNFATARPRASPCGSNSFKASSPSIRSSKLRLPGPKSKLCEVVGFRMR
jgi:hypothetical protein